MHLADRLPWGRLALAMEAVVEDGVRVGDLLAPPLAFCRCSRPQGRVVVVARYVESRGSLEDLVAGARRGSGGLDPVEARRAALLLALAVLELSRQGVVHGDLRPANVLYTPGGLPVVVDLDGASSMEEEPYYYTDESVIPGDLARPSTPGARDSVGLAWALAALASATRRDLARDYYTGACCTRRWVARWRMALEEALWPGAVDFIEELASTPRASRPLRDYWSLLGRGL